MKAETAIEKIVRMTPKINELDDIDKEMFILLGQMLIARSEIEKASGAKEVKKNAKSKRVSKSTAG